MKSPIGILIFLGICSILVESLGKERKFAFIVSETYENCAPDGQDANGLDMSEFELIAESDTEVALNGSIKFMRKVESTIPCEVYIEKFIRGQWVKELYDKKFNDLCEAIDNPRNAFYKKFEKQKRCPLDVGVKKVNH
jgi:hypothetical protein